MSFINTEEIKVDNESKEFIHPPPGLPHRIRKGDVYDDKIFAEINRVFGYIPVLDDSSFTDILVPYRFGLYDFYNTKWTPDHVLDLLVKILSEDAVGFTSVTLSKDRTKVKAKLYTDDDDENTLCLYYCVDIRRTPIERNEVFMLEAPDMMTIRVRRLCGDSFEFYKWFDTFKPKMM